MSNELISICIPTYQRVQLLKQALQSCLVQDYDNIEIIISDDSKDSETEEYIITFKKECKCKLKYVRNIPSLGQAGNVNQLFEMAEGNKLVLLHDDDLLLPTAISDLKKCWNFIPDLHVAFGKQYIISMTGEVRSAEESEKFNESYHRTSEKEGLQESAMCSALLQQFPGNSYMMLTSVAKSVRYRDEREVGTTRWCDFDFGIRVASKFDKFYFLNKYTSKYRITDVSISNSGGNPINYMYPLIQSLKVEGSAIWAKQEALKRLAPAVFRNYLAKREKLKALNVYLSENYTLKRRFSLRGLYYLALIFIS